MILGGYIMINVLLILNLYLHETNKQSDLNLFD